jgi:hypothetical protein
MDGTPLATDAARLSAVLRLAPDRNACGRALLTFETALAGDLHTARQDANGTLNDTEARLTPYGAIELRYPLQRTDANGVQPPDGADAAGRLVRDLRRPGAGGGQRHRRIRRGQPLRARPFPRDRTGANRASARRSASATPGSTRWAGRRGSRRASCCARQSGAVHARLRPRRGDLRLACWPRISPWATACASSTARCSTSSSTSPPTSFS